ncbi:hypothetical protein [Vibrio sp. V39_P1S14PM300]|uniref:hypothetical protein n=1 Tax=Vibrio sp. V39_P1S14PM300 TaxID=1938690 RepID=UPI0013737EE3|nr:hypothetical protein [Vibrio sp. V39_P1S14PM300]NAX21815.1 hypothetical protein [Vibrio sp. V39_P1S14PM300]
MSVKVFYQHRVEGPELVNHDKVVSTYHEACDIIDNYPWAEEMEWCEKLGEGGGFFFIFGDEEDKYATFQFTPIDVDKGLLYLDVVIKSSFWNLFGRNAVSKNFDVMSIPEAKQQLKELFDYSIESLYRKYKK